MKNFSTLAMILFLALGLPMAKSEEKDKKQKEGEQQEEQNSGGENADKKIVKQIKKRKDYCSPMDDMLGKCKR